MQTSPLPKITAVDTKSSPPSPPCWRHGALWGFVWLCWLTAIAVNVLVTPGANWLRHNDKPINWFTVGGGDEEVFGGCDVGLLNSHWCSYFAFFTVIQTTASIIVSVAAALLLVATCRRSPHRWRISSGTFFAIYAVLQAVAVGLVVATARKLEDALVANGTSSSEVNGRVGLPSLSSSSSSSSSVATEIEYGTTLLLGFCCGVVGFNASLVLCALARQAPSEVDPLCGCLCRKRRKENSTRRTLASAAGNGTNTRRSSRIHSQRGSRADNMISPTPSTAGSVVGAATNILRGSRQQLAAPTHPRPSGSGVDMV